MASAALPNLRFAIPHARTVFAGLDTGFAGCDKEITYIAYFLSGLAAPSTVQRRGRNRSRGPKHDDGSRAGARNSFTQRDVAASSRWPECRP
jgi:hypothetical protein